MMAITIILQQLCKFVCAGAIGSSKVLFIDACHFSFAFQTMNLRIYVNNSWQTCRNPFYSTQHRVSSPSAAAEHHYQLITDIITKISAIKAEILTSSL